MEHIERRKLITSRQLTLLAAVCLFGMLSAIPALAGEPYFSVSTDRTFQPGQKATIHLYSRDVDALEFRLYHVNEPTVFFEKLGDVHGFGLRSMSPKEEIDERTWIERFHDWKKSILTDFHRFLRPQFSARSRQEFREAKGRDSKKSNVSPAALFAQIPVLNSRQLVARWQQDVPPKFYSQRQDVPLEHLDTGVYVIEATDGKLRAYTVLVVSDLALVIKNAPGQVLAYATDKREGAPIPNTQVDLFGSKKKQVSGQTDDQGLALMPVSAERLDDIRIIGTHGKDVALIAPYYLSLSSNPAQDWTGYIYTDRPVYRPGHTVHFKGILRARGGSGDQFRVPAGEQVQIVVNDPGNKQVYQSNAVVTPFGGIHGDFTLAADAALGDYFINIRSRTGQQFGSSGSFYVEEYKKPEYEVKITPDKPRVLEGETINATIEARYYFGEPVAGAQVKYVVHRATSWSYLFGDAEDMGGGGEGDFEGGGNGEESEYAGDQLSEQSGKLDANGRLRITVPTTVSDHKYDYRYRIEARITDESRREIAGHNSVLATYGSFQIGVQSDKYLYTEGETIHLSALAKDYDGNPVRTSYRIEMLQREYRQGKYEETVTASVNGQTGSDGSGKNDMQARSGQTLRITATTPEGRVVQGQTWLWVVGPGRALWRENQQQLQIIADKKSYKPGETAQLLVMTNVPQAWLLITTEGQTLKSKRVQKVTSPTAMISVPITGNDEPNMFVSVAFVHNDTLFTGSKNLKVPATEKKLSITIEPSQPQFKPGEAARYNITALDAAGKPVAGEFSLGVVDESIYAVRPDATGDIHDFFYGSVGNSVRVESSFSFYFTGEAGAKPMFLAGAGRNYAYDHLAQLKPAESLVQPKIRKVFPDTALWLAEVRTDQSGHAQAQLNFPDSLTTWRATVRGNTQDFKVGSAVNRVIVRKNLMVRLAVPRFFRQGDDVTVSTIVHNYLTDDKTAQVSLDVKGLDLQDPGTRPVTVASKGDQRQDWHVHAQNSSSSNLVAKALTNEESDAMELTLPVIPLGVKLNDSKSGAISNALGQDQISINLPGDPATAAPTLKIDVNPSIAGSIFGALDYLTAYPYGCTEQTMSSFLPNIVVANAMKDLKLQSTINTKDLGKKINAGLDRLYDFQHDDGGWGWWKEDASMVFMTAYVVSGLAQAQSAGYTVDAERINRGREFLKGQLAQHERMKPDLRAYVVYALAIARASQGGGAQAFDSKWLDDAYNARSRMSSQGLAMLGLSLVSIGDNRFREVTGDLEKQAVATDSDAYWPSQYDPYLEFEIDDSVESTAYAVRLLSLTHPDSPLLPKAAFWLVTHRDGGYFWLSTKQTAMVVFGLLEYVKVSHELDADFTANVFVNDKQVLTRHYTRADAFRGDLPSITLAPGELQSGANKVRIQKSGPGRLYWSARGEYYSADKRQFQNNKISLSISRDYYRLTPRQEKDRISYSLDPLSGELHSGDVVAVRLGVNGSKWRYLLIEDPIPAGAEFIQNDGLYEFNRRESWWGFWFTRREFHDDRAAFFQTYFDGHQEYVYLLKIVNPGKFRVSPASVQPMYQPSILSTTDAATLEVK